MTGPVRDAAARRKAIAAALAESEHPLTGSELAARFGVTRAVIVHDIALLRAAGTPIVSTPQGYLHRPAAGDGGARRVQRIFVVRHGPALSELQAELNAIVDEGAVVRDVIVEHPVYGELQGQLMLTSRRDVQNFCDKMAASKGEPLLTLTDGIHLHTVEATDEATLERVRSALQRLGILLE